MCIPCFGTAVSGKRGRKHARGCFAYRLPFVQFVAEEQRMRGHVFCAACALAALQRAQHPTEAILHLQRGQAVSVGRTAATLAVGLGTGAVFGAVIVRDAPRFGQRLGQRRRPQSHLSAARHSAATTTTGGITP